MPPNTPNSATGLLLMNGEKVGRSKLAWLLGAQALVILPILINMPIWIWLVWAITAFWRIQMYRGHWGAPKFFVKAVLAFICIAGLYVSYSGKTGTETMVGMLVCAFSLKLLEVNSRRDAQLLILIGFITCSTQLLFSQTPLAALYALGTCLVLLASWRALYLTQPQTVKQQLQRAGAMLLHTLPVMLVLFIVIPRIGPLWAIPNQQTAKTGFSDSLSPGDLSKLVQSKEPAFRVEFESTAPNPANLYWRGLIMDKFDGRQWHLREGWSSYAQQNTLEKAIKTDIIRYSIIAEPHGQHWLFSLMTPLNAEASSNRIRIGSDSLLMARYPLAQRLRYQVTTALTIRWEEPQTLSRTEQVGNLQLPPDINPQARALAKSWQDQGMNDTQIVAAALGLFNQEFTYTLQPPTLGANSVDEFLFLSKRGFCEHFASSFSFLMRAAGVPTRVVVGYQGGRWNDVENYLLVSQADAHAWAEVWIDGKGWQTIDPTAAVAPERIEQGIDEALNEDDQRLVNNRWQSSPLLLTLQKHWDAAGYAWQRWVLSYDNEAQEGLLSKLLGGSEPWRITLWLMGLGLIGAAIFAWVLLRAQRLAPTRPETQAFMLLERKLQQLGYRRHPSETVSQFLQRVSRKQPDYQHSLMAIAQQFEAIAYRNADNHLPRLQAAIRRFPHD